MRTRTIIVSVCVALMVLSCEGKQQQSVSSVVDVKTAVVNISPSPTTKSYVGTVEESESSQLSFASMGTVSIVLVAEGDFVRKGQTMAMLDQTTLRNTYYMAKSTLRQAQDAYKRMSMLYKKGSLPEIKYIEIQTKLAQAESSERIARKNLTDGVLRAPFSGYVAEKMVDAGSNVVMGMGCFKLVKIDKVKVKISVPENEIANIRKGQTVNMSVSALGGKMFSGSVSEKGVQANPLSHTYDVKVELNNVNHELLPGMVANVEVSRGCGTKNIVIPQEAVLVDADGTFVWTVRGGKAHRQSVVSKDVNNQGTIIDSGLEEGAEVVVSGQSKISEGTKVKVL